MRKFMFFFIIFFMLLSIILAVGVILYFQTIAGMSSNKVTTEIKHYTAEDFGITVLKSKLDKDNDGIDDYSDILKGAKIDAENKPIYRSAYYNGGYPPDDEGVCTDVIWRAFKEAGYSLKDMIDDDIKHNINLYPRTEGKADPNIDFRRVPNLVSYFSNNQLILTTDLDKIEEWQPGDIVVYGTDHVGIISDIRNEKGEPYLIHNAGQNNREENGLRFYDENYSKITYHFRLKDV